MPEFDPSIAHEKLLDTAPLALRFDPAAHGTKHAFGVWRGRVRRKLRELVGWMPERCALDVRVEWEHEEADFVERRMVFTSEPGADVPCHLLLPRGETTPLPAMICLQGHSTGMHISLGRAKYEGDEKSLGGDRDFAIQAVKHGFAALAIEQRAFGERRDEGHRNGHGGNCHHSSMVSLLLGRTMIGERVWDVMRAIDLIETLPEVDAKRVGCMGNSGGGTITFFAACLERRIRAAMPSCYVCTFRDSIGRISHCQDNYIPGILRWFEMGDLAGVIAPRPLVVVAGEQDPIFPIEAVRRTYETIETIYDAAGAPDACALVVGKEGHRFYAAQAWPEFHRLTGWGKA